MFINVFNYTVTKCMRLIILKTPVPLFGTLKFKSEKKLTFWKEWSSVVVLFFLMFIVCFIIFIYHCYFNTHKNLFDLTFSKKPCPYSLFRSKQCIHWTDPFLQVCTDWEDSRYMPVVPYMHIINSFSSTTNLISNYIQS